MAATNPRAPTSSYHLPAAYQPQTEHLLVAEALRIARTLA